MTNRHQNYISFGEFHSKTLNELILMCSLICYNKIYSFLDRYSEYSLYWIIFSLRSKNRNQPLKALLTALLTYTINSGEMISIHHHDHPASVKEETWSENALKSPKYFFKHPQSFNNQVFPVSIKWYFPSSICSGQNHYHLPWFILLLSNTISNPSRNPIGCTFKRYPPSDQFSNPLGLPLNSKPSSSVFWIIAVVSSVAFQLWPSYPSSLFFTQHLKRFCSNICQIKSLYSSKLSSGIPPRLDSKPKSLQWTTGPYRLDHALTLQYPLNPFPVALPFPQLTLMGLRSICLKSSRQRELVLSFSSFGHAKQHAEFPHQGSNPVPPAGEVRSLNHWTAREVPRTCT